MTLDRVLLASLFTLYTLLAHQLTSADHTALHSELSDVYERIQRY